MKIKITIGNLLNVHIDRISVSCGSIKVVIELPDEITQSELSRMLNILVNKTFSIKLENGILLEKLSHISHNVTLFENELLYKGPVSSASCEKEQTELQEFNEFMKMFGGAPEGNNRRNGKNIIQFEPEGPANIFSPQLHVL